MSDFSRVHRQASDWFVAIHAAEDPAPDLVQAWLDWLDACEAHQEAYDDIVRIWHGTTPAIIASHGTVPSEADYDGSISVAEWRAREHARRQSPVWHLYRFLGGMRRRTLLAAALAALVSLSALVSLYTLELRKQHAAISTETFETRRGERLDLLLPDGSGVALGARSRLSIAYSSTERRLRLDAGQAFFRVQKDPRRPFTVLSLNGSITAVGTAFDVRAIADRVTVTVREGVVGVAGSPAAGARAEALQGVSPVNIVRVASGEQAVYDTSSGVPVPVITRVDPAESGRWRDGWLVYRNEPLKYVIADLSRYTNLNVDVDDSAGKLRFSGAVVTDQIAEWLVALPEVSPIDIERQGDGHVVIKLRSTALPAP